MKFNTKLKNANKMYLECPKLLNSERNNKSKLNFPCMAFKKLVCLSSKNHRKRSPSPRPNYETAIAILENHIPDEIKGNVAMYFKCR